MTKTPAEESRTILVVDDDDAFRERLIRALLDRGHQARGAQSKDEALALAGEESPEWAIVDLRMSGHVDGLELVRALLELDPSTRIVVLTGFGSIATALEAVRRGAIHYLSKPAAVDEVLARLSDSETPMAPLEANSVPSLARVEWEHIQRVLTECDGNITQAARLLGVHRRSLQRKLGKYPAPR